MSGVDLTLDGEDDDITGEPLEFLAAVMSVSYTHLTLPTILLV